MSFNSSQLNTFQLNGTGTVVASSAILEGIIFSLSETVPQPSVPLVENLLINFNTESAHRKNQIQVEIIEILDNSENKANLNNVLLNYISCLDRIVLQYPETVNDSMVILDNNLNILQLNTFIAESIIKSDIVINTATLFNILSSSLRMIGIIESYISESILDLVNVYSTLDSLHSLINSVIESIIADDTVESNNLFMISISDVLSSEGSISSTLTAKEVLNDILLVKIGGSPSSTFISYLLSPETNSVSTYSNYDFKLSCKFEDKYLFANNVGLYEYGGVSDDGTPIRAEMGTVAFNFNSSNLKQVPYMYLGVTSTDSFILKVRVDGKGEILYKLNKYTNNLMTQKVDIGKGLIGRYFQFELITDADEFNMESIEFVPLEIRRKI